MKTGSKPRYERWGEFLKRHRERKFRSARTFCAVSPLGISYPQYSRYESGEQLPSLEQALELCRILEVDRFDGLLHWNLAQLPLQVSDPEAAKLLERLADAVSGRFGERGAEGSVSAGELAPSLGAGVKLDELIVFNRSHLRLFGADAAYRDIFTYINSYSPEEIGASELSAAMGIPKARLLPMLRELDELGVIELDGERCLAAKRLFYFPDDETFFPVRNLNFIHNASRILRKLSFDDLAGRRAYRTLITRELTPAQLEALIARMDRLVTEVVEAPENGEHQKIYSLCLLLGERFDRAARSLDGPDAPGPEARP